MLLPLTYPSTDDIIHFCYTDRYFPRDTQPSGNGADIYKGDPCDKFRTARQELSVTEVWRTLLGDVRK